MKHDTVTAPGFPSWADLDEHLLDLLCPLCAQVIHVGLRGGVAHDAACRSAADVRAIIDGAEEDLSALSSYPQQRHYRPWDPPSRMVQVTNQLRQACLLGIPLSTTVRRPGMGWALLAPNEEVCGPGQSLAHWPFLVMARAGLVPPDRSAILRATVELSRIRYNRLLTQTDDSLIQGLRINEDILLSRTNGVLTGTPALAPPRWHPPGALVELQATSSGSRPAALDAIVLLSVHFAGCEAPP
jgi:hypothetical protein